MKRVCLVIGCLAALGVASLRAQQNASALLSQLGVAGPSADQPKGTGVIFGQVMDAGSNSPIGDAIVSLNMRVVAPGAAAPGTGPAPQAAPAPAGRAAGPGGPAAGLVAQKVMTDADGHFLFHDLPKGNVQLSTTAPGYISAQGNQTRPGGPSRPITLDDGERKTDVVVRLWKYAVVSGTVLDEVGEPAVGVRVTALRRTISAGVAQYQASTTATTDDRGVYRASSLSPGDYIVAIPQTQTTMPAAVVDAMMQGALNGGMGSMMRDISTSGAPAPTMSGLRVGDLMLQPASGAQGAPTATPGADGHLLAYATMAYPNATSPSQASTITLRSGEERAGIDFQLRVVPTAKVSGTVTGPTGPATTLGIRLVTAASDSLANDGGVPVAQTITTTDGSFTFLAVPAGQYRIKVLKTPPPQIPAELANNPMVQMAMGLMGSGKPGEPAVTLAADVPITVASDDIANVPIVLQEGVRLIGHVEFDGTAPKPTAAQMKQMQISLSVLGDPAGGMGGRISPSHLTEDGQFKTEQYPPGRYALNVNAATGQYRLAGVTVGGRPVTDALTIEQSDVTDVVISYTDQAGQIAGTVHGPDAQPYQTATVVIFPADRRLWTGSGALNTHAPRTATAQKTGTYTVAGLFAGEYLVAALDDADAHSDGLDETFLDALARVATRVTLADGEKKTLDLSIVRIK